MVKLRQNTGGSKMSETIVKLLESKNMSVTKVSERSEERRVGKECRSRV